MQHRSRTVAPAGVVRRLGLFVAVTLAAAAGGLLLGDESAAEAQTSPVAVSVRPNPAGPVVAGVETLLGVVVTAREAVEEVRLDVVEPGTSGAVVVDSGGPRSMAAGEVAVLPLLVLVEGDAVSATAQVVVAFTAADGTAEVPLTLPIRVAKVGGDGLIPTETERRIPPDSHVGLPLFLLASADVSDVVATVLDDGGLRIDPPAGTPLPLATGRPLHVGASDAVPLTAVTGPSGAAAHQLRIEVAYTQGERRRVMTYGVAVTVAEPDVVVIAPGGPSTEGRPDPYEYALYEGAWSRVPDFDAETAVLTGDSDTLGIEPTADPAVADAVGVGLRYRTCLTPPAAGEHIFSVSSDDGSWLDIDGYHVVVNDGTHAVRTATGTVHLRAAQYEIVVDWFDGGGDRTLHATVAGPDGEVVNLDDVVHRCEGPVTSLPRPVTYTLYEGNFPTVADLDGAPATATGRTFGFDRTQALFPTHYGLTLSTCFVAEAGEHTFRVVADDDARVSVDGVVVATRADEPTPVALDAGTHTITVDYTQTIGGAHLDVLWSGPGFDESAFDAHESC